MESTNLIALADEQLDVVAGGCSKKRDYDYSYDYKSSKHRRRGDVVKFDDVAVVVFANNDIDVDGDLTINITADA